MSWELNRRCWHEKEAGGAVLGLLRETAAFTIVVRNCKAYFMISFYFLLAQHCWELSLSSHLLFAFRVSIKGKYVLFSPFWNNALVVNDPKM